MTTAQQIANVINQSTKQTGATCSVVNGVAIAHIPAQSSIHGLVYDSVTINTVERAKSIVANMV